MKNETHKNRVDTSQYIKPNAKQRKLFRAAHEAGRRAGLSEEEAFPKNALIVPKHLRHGQNIPPEAFTDERYTKVRITMYLDLDVLNAFKARAAKNGTPYQTQINAALRELIETQDAANPAEQLQQAKGLIDAALRRIG